MDTTIESRKAALLSEVRDTVAHALTGHIGEPLTDEVIADIAKRTRESLVSWRLTSVIDMLDLPVPCRVEYKEEDGQQTYSCISRDRDVALKAMSFLQYLMEGEMKDGQSETAS